MSFIDKMLDGLDKVTSPARQQTVSDDVQSRLARQQRAERDRMQRVEHDAETGKPLLWFDVSITVGVHTSVPIAWAGNDWEDVNAAVIEWLNSSEFITVDFVNNGVHSKLTFRSSFVAHWEIGSGRARR